MKRIVARSILVVGIFGCAKTVTLDDQSEVIENIGSTTLSIAQAILNVSVDRPIVPVPNSLAMDPATGKINLSAECNESATASTLRKNILNGFDGFGLWQYPMYTMFTDDLDVSSLEGNIVFCEVGADGGCAAEVPIGTKQVVPTSVYTDTACTQQTSAYRLLMYAGQPLKENTNYVIVLKSGIKTKFGGVIEPSVTWSLLRQEKSPVVLTRDSEGRVTAVAANATPYPNSDTARLDAFEKLWGAHAVVRAIAAHKGITDSLIGWAWKTQTVSIPFDPSDPNSIAANLAYEGSESVTIVNEIKGDAAVTSFVESEVNRAFNVGYFAEGTVKALNRSSADRDWEYKCGRLAETPAKDTIHVDCSGIGQVLQGHFYSPNYQITLPTDGFPSFWMDPHYPTKEGGDKKVNFHVALPSAAAPAGGYPLVVYGHGIGESKEQMLFMASSLTQRGIAVAAMDWTAHGERAGDFFNPAAQTKQDCSDTKVMTYDNGRCFHPFITANPVAVRDNVRQSFVDGMKFAQVLKSTCAERGGCGDFHLDTNKMGFLGLSLGGLIGSNIAAMVDDYKVVAMTATGVNWLSTLEQTPNEYYRCPLFNALLETGVFVGPSASGRPWSEDVWGLPNACNQDVDGIPGADWLIDAGYLSFRAATTWVLDYAEGMNLAKKLAGKALLIQDVVNDETVPQITTDSLVGLISAAIGVPITPTDADTTIAGTTFATATAALRTDVTTTSKKWIKYTDICTGGTKCDEARQIRGGAGGDVIDYVHTSLANSRYSCSGDQVDRETAIDCKFEDGGDLNAPFINAGASRKGTLQMREDLGAFFNHVFEKIE
ncbi:MAG: hypothetical protein VYA34_08320 [Myxococcota bacterium]|nr:hypothetical protein [Myxococcota bacterium]